MTQVALADSGFEVAARPFDYAGIDPKLATKLRSIEGRVRDRNKSLMEAMIANGRDLLSVRDDLERGQFLKWVEHRCGLSKSAAYRFMSVAENLAEELPTLGSLPPAAIYELAAPTTPAPVRKEIVERLKAGETLAPEQIVKTVQSAREADRVAKAEAKLTPEEREKRARAEKRQRRTAAQRQAERDEMDRKRAEEHERYAVAGADLMRLLAEHLNHDELRRFVELLERCGADLIVECLRGKEKHPFGIVTPLYLETLRPWIQLGRQLFPPPEPALTVREHDVRATV